MSDVIVESVRTSGTVRDAVASRKSYSRVTDAAPTHSELAELVEAAASVADYGSLQPWRLIEIRGEARDRLGAAFVEATGDTGKDADKLASKPLRTSLLIAVVSSHKKSHKVEGWEQDIAAAGVAHTLSLLLHDAGWGVMWRTGKLTDTAPVRRVHNLDDNEKLFGWLYIGGLPEKIKPEKKRKFDANKVLSSL